MQIAIVDDEQIYLDSLHNMVSEELAASGITDAVISCYHSAEEFFADYQPQKFHLIFLDIFLTDGLGVDIAEKIREEDEDVILAFCTTSNDFAAQSYEVNASYYIQKPLSKEKISAMLKRINFSALQKNQTIQLPDNYICVLNHIKYTFYSNHSVTFAIDKAADHSVYMAQSDLESMLLSHEGFIAVNRGTVVNMRYIDSINAKTIVMKDGTQIPISRSKYKEVFDVYSTYLMKQSLL